MEGAAKFIVVIVGALLTIFGVGGVPLAVQAGNMTNLALFTVMFFAGIGILGWAYRE